MESNQLTESVALAAYAVACPACGSATGDPCRERYCRNGYAGCTYKVCSRVRDLPEPHVARVARAAARATSPADEIPQQPTCEDHGKCCTYRLCAHPKCCGYALLPSTPPASDGGDR